MRGDDGGVEDGPAVASPTAVPSVGHLVVGLAAARAYAPDARARPAATAAFVALSMFPDLDVAARALGAPAGSAWLHRGALHSLAVASAAGVAVALVAGGLGRSRRAMAVAGALVAATHGLLDTLTGGGAGVMLLWPASTARLAAWHLVPASPIGLRLASARGVAVAVRELVLLAPLVLYALWPLRARASVSPSGPPTARLP